MLKQVAMFHCSYDCTSRMYEIVHMDSQIIIMQTFLQEIQPDMQVFLWGLKETILAIFLSHSVGASALGKHFIIFTAGFWEVYPHPNMSGHLLGSMVSHFMQRIKMRVLNLLTLN